MLYHNNDLPPGIKPEATPTNVVIGRLPEQSDLEQIASQLEQLGIETDRLHALHGEDGIVFINNAGTWLGRLFRNASDFDQVNDLLTGGATLLSVHFVEDEDEEDRVAAAFGECGITTLRRFGQWVYS